MSGRSEGAAERVPDRTDMQFMSEVSASIVRETHPLSSAVLYLTAIFFAVAILWASDAVLDEFAIGPGRVIPSRQVQTIQNLEGGILAELVVTEGQIVEKDQRLLRIDDTRFTSSYREARVRRLALLATIARLTAEAHGRQPVFPKEVRRGAPHLVASETELFESRRRALEETLAGIKRSLELATQELKMSEPLVAQGALSEVEVLRLRRQVNELKTAIDDRRNRFVAQANEELAKTRNELAGLVEASVAVADRVKRTVVRSPVRGVVNKINMTTIGAVIQPGASIMEIVPLEDTLLIEAQIRPEDIAFIHPGQPATVKITAYDYSIYGGLPGKVTHVSADSLLDEKRGLSYYKALVRTEAASIQYQGKSLPIIPGMVATVDVLTGSKTVLDYLLKPVLKAREKALRER